MLTPSEINVLNLGNIWYSPGSVAILCKASWKKQEGTFIKQKVIWKTMFRKTLTILHILFHVGSNVFIFCYYNNGAKYVISGQNKKNIEFFLFYLQKEVSMKNMEGCKDLQLFWLHRSQHRLLWFLCSRAAVPQKARECYEASALLDPSPFLWETHTIMAQCKGTKAENKDKYSFNVTQNTNLCHQQTLPPDLCLESHLRLPDQVWQLWGAL